MNDNHFPDPFIHSKIGMTIFFFFQFFSIFFPICLVNKDKTPGAKFLAIILAFAVCNYLRIMHFYNDRIMIIRWHVVCTVVTQSNQNAGKNQDDPLH